MAKSEEYKNNYLCGKELHNAAMRAKHNLVLMSQKQTEADKCYKLAIKYFWKALVLGCDKAPFYLFDCLLMSDSGVAKDEDIMVLMYGAALQLTEKKCKKISEKDRPIISNEMQPTINKLVELINKQAKDPSEGEGMEKIDSKAEFNNIKLPSGELIADYFATIISRDSSIECNTSTTSLSSLASASYHGLIAADVVSNVSEQPSTSLKGLIGEGCNPGYSCYDDTN